MVRAFDGVHLDGKLVFIDVVAEIFDGGGGIGVGESVEHDGGEVWAEVRKMLFGRFFVLRTAFDGGGLGGFWQFSLAVFGGLCDGGSFFFLLVGATFEEMAENHVADGFQGDIPLEET